MALVRCLSGFSYAPTAGNVRTIATGELLDDSDAAVVARRSLFSPTAAEQAVGVTELSAAVQTSLGLADTAVQVGGDVGGTSTAPTVTATHLAAALPLAQGGTAATSAADARTSLGLGAAAVMSTAQIAADTALTGTYAQIGQTRVDVEVYGGDLAAAIAAAPSGSRFLLNRPTYTIAAPLNFDGTTNVKLQGSHSGEDRDHTPVTEIRYTGAGTAPAISARTSQGFTLQDLAVRYSSSSFTGRLIDVRGSDAGLPTYQPKFVHLHAGGLGGAVVTADAVIDLGNTVEARFEDPVITRAQKGIVGWDGLMTFSTAVQFRGGRFVDIVNESVRNTHQQWIFYGTVFENSTTGAPSGIVQDSTHAAQGVSLFGVGFWDATAAGQWIDWYGDCLNVIGGFVGLGTGITYCRLNGVVNGFKSFGNYVAGNPSSVYLATANTPSIRELSAQDMLVNGIPNNVAPLAGVRFEERYLVPCRKIKTVTSDYTAFARDGVIFADTTGGDITITMPDALVVDGDNSSVARELTIIKTAAGGTVHATPVGGQRLNGGFGLDLTALGGALHMVCDGQAAPGGWWTLSDR